jgi:hypothetical protein
MPSDKPYSVGDIVTFRDALGRLQPGEIVGTAQLVVLDGSQTAYRVRLHDEQGEETGEEVGIGHTNVLTPKEVKAAAKAAEADAAAAAVDAEVPDETPGAETAAETATETGEANDGTPADDQTAV